MGQIRLLLVALLLMPTLTVDKAIYMVRKSTQFKQVFQMPVKQIDQVKPNQYPVTSPVDTTNLKKTGWYAGALHSIEESEYELKPVKQNGTFTSVNRSQNLRASYTPKSFALQPRKDSSENWDLVLSTQGIYTGENLLYAPDENPVISQQGNTIQFNHQNNFITEYINSSSGIRQNFIIEKEPAVKTTSLTVKLQVNDGWYLNKVHAKEIHFAKAVNNGFDKKLTYNQLKVWDGDKKELDANFSINGNTISINVNTNNAVYPLTIDPLSSTANVILESNQGGALMGRYLSTSGDVNGDGYSDVIVGVPLYDNGQTDEGAAFIYYGSATGISSTPAVILECNQAGAGFGTGVGGAGDVNGDGYGDIVIGALNYDNGQTDEGAAFVYYGSPTGITLTPAAILESNQANAQMGFYIDGAGDINGDGYSDIVVGVYLYDNGQTDEGAVFVYHGSAIGIVTPPAAILESNRDGTFFGREVAGAGDVNGDGYSDIVVGAYGYNNGQTDEGAAYVFHGSATGIISAPALILESNQTGAALGISVASAGDVNGDGYSDIIAGAYFYDNTIFDEGAAFIYHGSASGVNSTPVRSLYGKQAESRFGAAVASAGDVNGDGYSDVIVGAYFYDNGQTDEGTAFLYYGSAAGIPSTSVTMVEPNQGNTTFGIAISSAGDINGDGYSDLIIGAMWYDNGQTDEGAAFIYHGGPESLSATPFLIDNITQDRASFGITLDGAGDVNGDGYSDVIIGAPLYDDNGADEGRAFVYYGSATGLSKTASVILDEANQGGANFAFSVAGAGDVNGDGFSDVIAGAWQYNGVGRTYVYFGSTSGLSAISNQRLNGTQGGEGFGVSVSGAGDVNKDGFSDVIIGAYAYDVSGRADEGRAYVYYGSSAGLNTTTVTILNDAGQAAANFGRFVSTAGDVNGDGFSDVIVGAPSFDDGASTDEGAVFVHYGGCSGISISANQVLKDADESSATFCWVSEAGDLNGDGFSDIVVGAIRANANRGRGFVYYGSSSGLSSPPVILNNNFPNSNSGDWMRYGVGCAGDVNGDGYSDLMIGVPQWESPGLQEQGRVFVYYGSPTGISTTPDRILADNPNSLQFFGDCVAGVGDVNGDGFSDVVVGGDHGSWAGYGIAYVYYGNDKLGLRNNLRLYNTDLSAPMNKGNINDASSFGAGLYTKSFLGQQKGKLVWQTSKNGTAFTGLPITNNVQSTAEQATFTNLGLSGAELKSVINKASALGVTYIRARVKYDPVTAITGQVYGPWRYPAGYLKGNREIAEQAMTSSKIQLLNDTAVCFNSNYTINAFTAGATSYTWQNGATGPTFNTTSAGLYWVDIVLGGCTYRDSVVLSSITVSTTNINPKICEGQTYSLPSGKAVNATGIYKDTVRSVAGCDSLITNVTLDVDTVKNLSNNVSICGGQSYSLPSGKAVSIAGFYEDTIRYKTSNCDSLITNLTLTVATVSRVTQVAVICAGASYQLPSGKNVNTAAIYQDTLRAQAGCDSVITNLTLKVNVVNIQSSNAYFYIGQTYTLPWGRITNVAGIYHDTLKSVAGCDSLITIVDLKQLTVQSNIRQAVICAGSSHILPWGGNVNRAGSYADTIKSVTGADSLLNIVELMVLPRSILTPDSTVCQDAAVTLRAINALSFAWSPSTGLTGLNNAMAAWTATTDRQFRLTTTHTNPDGGTISCTDSVQMNVVAKQVQNQNIVICNGQNYTLPSGRQIGTTGLYSDTMRSVSGCDSLIVNIDITVQSSVTEVIATSFCEGQAYLLPWGKIVGTAGVYRDTLRYLSGCDSLRRTVNLSIKALTTSTNIVDICSGKNYTLPWGIVVNTSGAYSDTTRYVTGCDSLIRTIQLTLQNPPTLITNTTICEGQTYTLPSGTKVAVSGKYTDTLYSLSGCDSVWKTVNLTVQQPGSIATSANICSGQTYTLPWGEVVSAAGIYRDTLHYRTGCDSVRRTVNLTVQQPLSITTNAVICEGQTYTLSWGRIVSSGGVYRDTLHYSTGCDSIRRTVNLTVKQPVLSTTNAFICLGQSYTLPWGTIENKTGVYRDTLKYIAGCDSVRRVINLIVQPASSTTASAIICEGERYTLPWGAIVATPGIYRDTLRYVGGCDSLRRTINLTVQTAAASFINVAICTGKDYVLPSGAVVNKTGIYLDTLRYSTGCDSLRVRVNLMVTAASIVNTAISICSDQTYQLPWGAIVNTAGIYRDTVRSSGGCDSLVRTVVLTVRPKPVIRITKSNDVNCIIGTVKLNAYGADKYAWTPASTLNNAFVNNPVATPTQTTSYVLTATALNGCIAKDSIEVKLLALDPQTTYPVPSSFTPNNDGLNDCFGVTYWGNVTDFNCMIYDRYGHLIFQTTNPTACWDGRRNGTNQNIGAYVYLITARGICGPINRQGTVMLVR